MKWEIDGFNVTSVIQQMQDGTWRHVCTCNFDWHDGTGEHFQLNKDNAKLIRSAPDLLENLTRLIDRIEENNLQSSFPSAYQRAKEAIKKATPKT